MNNIQLENEAIIIALQEILKNNQAAKNVIQAKANTLKNTATSRHANNGDLASDSEYVIGAILARIAK